jgi:hypothetical protein
MEPERGLSFGLAFAILSSLLAYAGLRLTQSVSAGLKDFWEWLPKDWTGGTPWWGPSTAINEGGEQFAFAVGIWTRSIPASALMMAGLILALVVSYFMAVRGPYWYVPSVLAAFGITWFTYAQSFILAFPEAPAVVEGGFAPYGYVVGWGWLGLAFATIIPPVLGRRKHNEEVDFDPMKMTRAGISLAKRVGLQEGAPKVEPTQPKPAPSDAEAPVEPQTPAAEPEAPSPEPTPRRKPSSKGSKGSKAGAKRKSTPAKKKKAASTN